MEIRCTKQELRKMIVSCNESQGCYNCAIFALCDPNGTSREKGEFLAEIVTIVENTKEASAL